MERICVKAGLSSEGFGWGKKVYDPVREQYDEEVVLLREEYENEQNTKIEKIRHAFNNRKLTGKDVIDFVKYRQLLAEGHPFDDKLKEAVLPKPMKKPKS